MKKFYRNKSNRILSGICGGLGEYTDSDPLLWRLIFIMLFFCPVPIFLLYIITTFITKSIHYD